MPSEFLKTDPVRVRPTDDGFRSEKDSLVDFYLFLPSKIDIFLRNSSFHCFLPDDTRYEQKGSSLSPTTHFKECVTPDFDLERNIQDWLLTVTNHQLSDSWRISW
jgi:hypothetical protein